MKTRPSFTKALKLACVKADTSFTELAKKWNCSAPVVSLVASGHHTSAKLRKAMLEFIESVDPSFLDEIEGEDEDETEPAAV